MRFVSMVGGEPGIGSCWFSPGALRVGGAHSCRSVFHGFGGWQIDVVGSGVDLDLFLCKKRHF